MNKDLKLAKEFNKAWHKALMDGTQDVFLINHGFLDSEEAFVFLLGLLYCEDIK